MKALSERMRELSANRRRNGSCISCPVADRWADEVQALEADAVKSAARDLENALAIQALEARVKELEGAVARRDEAIEAHVPAWCWDCEWVNSTDAHCNGCGALLPKEQADD